MSFRVGCRVEVLSKKKGPPGAWRVAEIVSNNGDNYDVRYERYRGIRKATIDSVKKDAIRPCPPPVKSVADWEVGDIVEVFDDGYWKVAVIESMAGEGFFVRVLGSFDEFKVRKASTRVRQSWEDNKWIVLEKDFFPCEDLISKARKRAATETGYKSQPVKNDIGVQEACLSYRAPMRALPDYSANPEAHVRNPPKKRTVEENGRHRLALPECSPSLSKKVDAAVYVPDSWSQNNCRASRIDRKSAIDKYDIAKQNADNFHSRILDQNDSGSPVSSVGSCSPFTTCSNRVANDALAGAFNDVDTFSSDAESCFLPGNKVQEYIAHSEKKYVSRTHESALDTYRGTLEALYAIGPLSWELETYLTDLRSSLHISSDEHLAEDEVLWQTWISLSLHCSSCGLPPILPFSVGNNLSVEAACFDHLQVLQVYLKKRIGKKKERKKETDGNHDRRVSALHGQADDVSCVIVRHTKRQYGLNTLNMGMTSVPKVYLEWPALSFSLFDLAV